MPNLKALDMCDLSDRSLYQVSTTLILASPQVVWSVLTDNDKLPSRFATMKRSTLLRRAGANKVYEQQVQPLPPYPAVTYVVELTETYAELLAWSGLSSYIKVNLGYFSLHSREDGRSTFVVYAKRIEGALLVPHALIRQQLETIMPSVLRELKLHAEGISGRDSPCEAEASVH